MHFNSIPTRRQERFTDGLFTREGWHREFVNTLAEEVNRKKSPLLVGTMIPSVTRSAHDQVSIGGSRYLSTSDSIMSADDLMEETWQLTYPWEEQGGEGEDVAGSKESPVFHCIAFNCLKIAVLRGFSDLQEMKMTLQATAEAVVANQLGDWIGLIAQHGSVEQAIEAVSEPQLRQLEEVVNKARAKMEERVLQLETRGGADKSALSQVI